MSNVLFRITKCFTKELKGHPVAKYLKNINKYHLNADTLVKKANNLYIKNELIRSKELFETIESQPLSNEQQLAVLYDEDHNLIVAAAGSGKTSVIIAKLAHLLSKNILQPREILVLAFNRLARDELKERIKKKIDHPDIDDICVMTFHELGYSITGMATGRKPSVANYVDSPAAKSRHIRNIIDELRKDRAFEQILLEWFALHLYQYKSEFDFQTLGEYFQYLKDNQIVSLKREKVRSYEECMIANFLILNGVEYEYESSYLYETADSSYRQYKPDFYLPKYKIYIEHFGINRDGNTAPFVKKAEYIAGMEWKRKLHQDYGTTLVETYSYERMEGKLIASLKDKLTEKGVIFKAIAPEIALESMVSKSKYDLFSSLVAIFLGHYKSNEFNEEILYQRIGDYPDKARGSAFAKIFMQIYSKYQSLLMSNNEIDFEGMIQQASGFVANGDYLSPYRYILVDEFQDISVGRAELIRIMCEQDERTQLFAVGDDWQSIYRFAGADIAVMREFTNFFGVTAKSYLSTTYRCNEEIAKLSASFILKNPAQLPKEVKGTHSRGRMAVNIITKVDKNYDPVSVALGIIQTEKDNASVLVLGRYRNNKPDNWSQLINNYPNLIIQYSTVHSAKGLEADHVIIVELKSGQYGFPSEKQDDPLLNLVLAEREDFEFAEERRLFYVAMTRARDSIYLVKDKEEPSRFVSELEKYGASLEYNSKNNGLGSSKCPTCKSGSLIVKTGKNGNFVGCIYYPLCSYTTSICPLCKEGIILINETTAECANCGANMELCSKCGKGYMVTRTSSYGDFMSCSQYPVCNYKYNMH